MRIVQTLIAAGVVGLTAWEFNSGMTRAATDSRQDEQITTLQKQFDRVDDKLDAILEEIRQDNRER